MARPNLSQVTIIDALRDPRLISDVVSPAQETALRALYALPLGDEQLAIFQRATNREAYEPHEYREATYICGRRSGKSSRLAANIAVYEAVFRRHEVARGEVPWVVVIAPTRKQAGIVFQYVLGRLRHSPALRSMIVEPPSQDQVTSTNGVSIGVWPCNYPPMPWLLPTRLAAMNARSRRVPPASKNCKC